MTENKLLLPFSTPLSHLMAFVSMFAIFESMRHQWDGVPRISAILILFSLNGVSLWLVIRSLRRGERTRSNYYFLIFFAFFVGATLVALAKEPLIEIVGTIL